MEKLKDFIYDKNDILVALLVLFFAALLILWRMDAIMEYPEKMFTAAEESGSELEYDEGESQSGGGSAAGDAEDEGDAGEESGDSEEKPSGSLWVDGKLTRTVEVDVYGNSAMAAVQCLVDTGLFLDYDEYKVICDLSGMNHEKVSAGTLVFEPGCTKEQVARKINWS